MTTRPALVRRWPRLLWRDQAPAELIPAADRAGYPDLAADLAVLDRELVPLFCELDTRANRAQNRYRRQHVLLIGGSILVTVLGATQAALPGQAWPGLAISVLAVTMAAATQAVREHHTLPQYFDLRMRAERLRALYFAFLGDLPPFGRATSRLRLLRERVAAIHAGGHTR